MSSHIVGVAEQQIMETGSNPAPWTTDEQKRLEQALKTFPASTPERWDRIATAIPTRSRKDCMRRYKVRCLCSTTDIFFLICFVTAPLNKVTWSHGAIGMILLLWYSVCYTQWLVVFSVHSERSRSFDRNQFSKIIVMLNIGSCSKSIEYHLNLNCK